MQTSKSWNNLLEHFATEPGKVEAFLATKGGNSSRAAQKNSGSRNFDFR